MANSSSDIDTKSLTESQQLQPHEPQPQPRTQPQPQSQPQPHPQLQPGYPFPPPYQGYPPPYQGYPNNYQYGPPPPGVYYPPGASQNYVIMGPPQRNHGYNLARVFLVMMIIIFVGMSVMSLLTWVIYGSDIPIFYIESLAMTVFNMSTVALNSTWDASVTVRNPNHKFEVSYDFVEATLVYDDHLLDTNYVEPFHLGKNDKRTLNTKFEMPNTNQKNITGASWVKDIENECQGSGVVAFDMRIIVNAIFMADNHRSTSRTLKILCGDLEVAFPVAKATVGNLIGGNKECLVMSN